MSLYRYHNSLYGKGGYCGRTDPAVVCQFVPDAKRYLDDQTKGSAMSMTKPNETCCCFNSRVPLFEHSRNYSENSTFIKAAQHKDMVSGGLKRRLWLAIAWIGDLQVVF